MARMPNVSCRSSMLFPARVAVMLAGLLSLLGLAACMGDLPGAVPTSDIGVVEGRVRESSQGVPARVQFRDDEGSIRVTYTVVADSTGWYHAELPLGQYRMQLSLPDTSDVIFGSQTSKADTILVGRCVRRRDFECGRGRVTVMLPAIYEGNYVELSISSPRNRVYRMVHVRDGVAEFDLRLLTLARYAMRLDLRNGIDEFLLPGTYVQNQADSLDARSGSASYEIDLRGRSASLSGSVTGSWQSTSGGMEVGAVTLMGRSVATTSCAPDGTFRLETLMPEPVVVVTNYRSVSNWYGGHSAATATVIDLRPGDHVDGLDMVEGGVDIRLDGPGDLVPRSHSIVLRREDGGELELAHLDGNPVRIGNLPEGRYWLRVGGVCFGESWLPQWYGGALDADGAVPVDIVPGAVQSIAMALQAGGSISGRIVDESSSARYGYYVSVHDGTGVDMCETSIYMRSDQWFVGGLPDGEYCLSVNYAFGGHWWYPGTRDQAQATRLTISGGNAVTGLIWPMPAAMMAAGWAR